MEKSERWRQMSEATPGPGAYNPDLVPAVTPKKWPTSASSSRLNSSTVSTGSNGSSASSGLFLSPPRPRALTRSTSTRAVRGHPKDQHGGELGDLQGRIRQLTEERDQMKEVITQLESQLTVLKHCLDKKDTHDAATAVSGDADSACKSVGDDEAFVSPGHERNGHSTPNSAPTQQGTTTNQDGLDVSILAEQLNVTRRELAEAQQVISTLTDERSGFQLKLKEMQESGEKGSLSEEAAAVMKEEISHLTHLRDNLEASLLVKEDLIAELQLQLDEMVADATSSHIRADQFQVGMQQLQHKLDETVREKYEVEGRVRDLVARYESLVAEKEQQRHYHQETITKKDIEIQLLNTSITNLNSKISEYEMAISTLEEEAARVSVLEATVSELSLAAKERELTDTMHQEELNARYQEVTKLEQKISEVEASLMAAKAEKESQATKLVEVEAIKVKLSAKLSEAMMEKKRLAVTLEKERERAQCLETEVKEKEVVQQFLEKEMEAREAELAESSRKLCEVEEELETARSVALDLQQEAEMQLNQVLTLKATISAKDYDIEAKAELISTLQEEMSHRQCETTVLQEKLHEKATAAAQVEEMLTCKEDQLTSLMEELGQVRATVRSREDSVCDLQTRAMDLANTNRQLEERIVELMAEISDREAQHIGRVTNIESDLEDLGVKYSEALLEQEATRRVLTHTTEQLEQERLVRGAAESDLAELKEEHQAMECNLRNLVQKYTSLEDALACEEAENRDLEERLEREVAEAKAAAAEAQREVEALITSNSGFCTQITQLKIDMRKKSDAVEEMQQCIEVLREEKQHLTTLRDNLESTVASRDDTIAQLRLRVSTVEREAEEDRVTLRSRVADLENHLKETQEEVDVKADVMRVLEGKVTQLEEESLKQSKTYEQQLEEKTQTITQLLAKLEELTRQYDGYKDQLRNLETSLLEKVTELEQYKSEMGAILETTANRLRQEVDQANQSLADKTFALDSINATLSTTQDELATLHKSLAEKDAALNNEQQRVKEVESHKNDLNQEIQAAEQTITQLKHDLSAVQEQLASAETKSKEAISAECSRLSKVWEEERGELTSTNASITEELNMWKNKFLHLEKMIEPFREQLDAYEVEKASLLERSSAAKEEVDKLSKQYAKLLGHQNHKQKIQHVLQLKTENGQLKEEVHKLRQEGERQRKAMRRLEEKMSRLGGSTTRLHDTSRSLGDKENSNVSFLSASTSSLAPPSSASTPLRSNNRPQRL